jgi:cytoskeletal protein RodZ
VAKQSNKKTKAKKPASTRLKFRVPFKPIETAIILGVLLLGTSAILYQKHEQKVHEQLNIAPAYSQSSQDTQSSPAPSTSTPTQPAQSSATTSPSDSSSTDCTDKTVPYTTTYQDVTWIQTGQTMNLPGTNGTDRICDGNVTVITKPFNAIDYIGTGTNLDPSTVTPTQPNTEPYQNIEPSNGSGLTESQAAQQCDNNLANGADASDPQGYLDSCMQQYGY